MANTASFVVTLSDPNLSVWQVNMDGVSTSLVLDFADVCKKLPLVHRAPLGIDSASVSGLTVQSSSLSGTVVTMNFASAPAAGAYSSTVRLNFSAV